MKDTTLGCISMTTALKCIVTPIRAHANRDTEPTERHWTQKNTEKSKFTEIFMRQIAHETIPLSILKTQTHTGQSVPLQTQFQTIYGHK